MTERVKRWLRVAPVLSVLVFPLILFTILALSRQHYVRLPYLGPKKLVGATDTLFYCLPKFTDAHSGFTSDSLRNSMSIWVLDKPADTSNVGKATLVALGKLNHDLKEIYMLGHDLRLIAINQDSSWNRFAAQDSLAAPFVQNVMPMADGQPLDDYFKRLSKHAEAPPYFYLVDPSLHLRGRYAVSKKEELDRLEDEIKVLRVELREQHAGKR